MLVVKWIKSTQFSRWHCDCMFSPHFTAHDAASPSLFASTSISISHFISDSNGFFRSFLRSVMLCSRFAFHFPSSLCALYDEMELALFFAVLCLQSNQAIMVRVSCLAPGQWPMTERQSEWETMDRCPVDGIVSPQYMRAFHHFTFASFPFLRVSFPALCFCYHKM